MSDESWDLVQQTLSSGQARHLATMVPEDVFALARQHGCEHPLEQLVQAARSSPTPLALIETDRAFEAVSSWLSSDIARAHVAWWAGKLKRLGEAIPTASGTLAEIRAFGSMLSNLHEITHVPVRPNFASGKASDFCFDIDPAVYVEVCCLRMNDEEWSVQRDLDSAGATLEAHTREAALQHLKPDAGSTVTVRGQARLSGETNGARLHEVQTTAVRRGDGRQLVLTMSTRDVRPQGPDKPSGMCNTVASRIAGKKPCGQVPEGRAGVLWMDCCDSSWPLSSSNTQPASVSWKGMNLATTDGVWHSFYGIKGKTPMMIRGLVGRSFKPLDVALQDFNGRFRAARGPYWSAAVLRCTDGLVIFENPHPSVQLPFEILRALTALRGYNPSLSFHRWSEAGWADLEAAIERAEQQLRFYADGSA